MLIKPEIEKFARIKVIGVGGGGSNAIRSMMEVQTIQGVDFVAVNTDAQALSLSLAPQKVQIGRNVTHGLGSGGMPDVGRKAAEESIDEIRQHVEETDMVFLTAGMGGGTGTGATPIIAELAKKSGALTVGVVTRPFDFEGAKRRMQADEGITNLREKVDTLITIPNQRLLQMNDAAQLSLLEAFHVADSVLGQSVKGISDVIVMPGLINRDFADVRTIMQDAGSALMGIGTASGEERAVQAARNAIENPLLESTIEGAKGILFNVSGGPDLTLVEVDAAAKIIAEAADPDANIIFGATIDEEQGGQVKITVIATGFSPEAQKRREVKEFSTPRVEEKDSDQPGLGEELETPAFMRRR